MTSEVSAEIPAGISAPAPSAAVERDAAAVSGPDHPSTDEQLLSAKLVPLRRPGQWISAAVLLVLLAMLVNTLLTNRRFQWDVVGHYLFQASILHGLELTLWLTAAVLAAGYLIGTGVAAMRLSPNPILKSLSFGFVWLIRSLPLLVQLLFWYEIASLYPRLSFGIPFGPEFAGVKTAHLFNGVFAAFIALTLDVAAFSSELIRGGILAVPSGQVEAAQALGLGKGRIFRRIVLPQAMPSIIPASGNLLIGMLKATSVISVIAVQDLLYSTQLIYNENFQVIPLLLVATLWYIALTTVLSIGQYFVERHYARGTDRRGDTGFPGFRQAFTANLPLFGRAGRPARAKAATP
ncbi:polar amino acid ABC transporter, inner membrane subunit [Catenulispora acidiphila DSM 44928]|uniref:Polar amino acid ABC transporter, inner membrane subunit n=1 Tax=Catenulispora acidiphila (strain DSM 44928 / JCM 14897 / NBRC 102108 / NRRL B-24433 / ID139908) TaxID=479433 RepID=C7QDA7_CATAD|nr:amino acid ABC transporter permease [Catenulispora acidiphila]ACU72700.1 polar amino acid ABC transporter, inner membrane subunit [Catenulispora acidiphila DSM 44928]